MDYSFEIGRKKWDALNVEEKGVNKGDFNKKSCANHNALPLTSSSISSTAQTGKCFIL